MKNLIVQKFGGTSVGSVERIQRVADRVIATQKRAKHVVVVVSAMGDTTDDLIDLAHQISKSPDPREYDALISNGENISASLLAMSILEKGGSAISLRGNQAGIQTEPYYKRAKITAVNSSRIQSELENGKIVIVTGFQGINHLDDVTTIGRGGSDTSAVVLAAALNADECEIFTDVDGVYTTDPRLVKNAKKLSVVSYDEMLEMASLGAQVLHPRSVECAKENNIVIHVRSSFDESEGTLVKEVEDVEGTRPVTGVTLKKNEASVSIMDVPNHPGVAGKVFMALAKHNINIDVIVQSTENNQINNISFTVSEDDLDQTVDIANTVAKEIGASGVKGVKELSKVSIVGVGMISKPGVAAKMFDVLGQNNINIHFISTSEIKISCIVDKQSGEKALQLLHEAFQLDQ